MTSLPPPHDNVVRLNIKPPPTESSIKKCGAFAAALKQGITTLVLDARVAGVRVPSMYASQKDLRLNFSYRFGLKDFMFDGQGVEATLSFSEGYFFCQVPWEAVFAIESVATQTSSIWPENIPSDAAVAPSSPKPGLRLVKDTEK